MPANSSHARRPTARSIDCEDINARGQVIRYFQEFVNSGCAMWHINEEGQIELRLERGAAFLLPDVGIVRLT